jgi:hypothetical protein
MSIIRKIKNKFKRKKETEILTKKLTENTSCLPKKDSWYDVLLSNEPFRYPSPSPPPNIIETRKRTL